MFLTGVCHGLRMHRLVIRSRRTRNLAATLCLATVAAAGVALHQTAEAQTSPNPPAADAVVAAEYNLGDKAFTDKKDWPQGFSEMKAIVPSSPACKRSPASTPQSTPCPDPRPRPAIGP